MNKNIAILPSIFLLFVCLIVQAQSIDNGEVCVEPILADENAVGFSISTNKTKIAEIKFSPLNRIIAGGFGAGEFGAGENRYKFLTFGELKSVDTPVFSDNSSIIVKLFPDDPYPEVEFKLKITDFSKRTWEKVHGTVPFHFLSCSMKGAEIFYQRGWPIPTPVIDEYPLHNEATGYGRQITSEWSKDWTYAPPIGAYPVASVGLWKPSSKRFVAYDFHGARLTDNSEKEIGSAYCWKLKDAREFFTLVVPYAKPYRKLRYPKTDVKNAPSSESLKVASHFRILYSTQMASDDDPNLFVNNFIWNRYAGLMPEVPTVNDLSWLPKSNRMHTFPKPGIGRLYYRVGKNARWFKPGALVNTGVSWDGDPISYLYETGQKKKIEQLKEDIDFLLKYAKKMEIDGDECYFWEKPLEGEGIDMFGPGVPTMHNIQGWQVVSAMLDLYRNERTQTQLLPYIDGALRYTKHILYTRNGYADVPTAQFAWGAGPVTTFCLRYYYAFRDEPDRKELAHLAYKLARTMLYRYLPLWASDNDKMDNLDSSFMMEPNSGISWLGAACSNEVWVVPYALAQVYVATGDPILGHYLRGMLNRWHELYRDEYYPTVTQYNGALTERLGLFDGAAQAKGTRASYGGLWGLFERLAWPIKNSNVCVLCGEKAAMAFNKSGVHTKIKEYRYYGDGEFAFRVLPISDELKQDEPFDLTITFPYFDLREKTVYIVRDEKKIKLSEDRVEKFDHRPDSLYIRGIRYGDRVTIGKFDEVERTPLSVQEVERTALSVQVVGDFHIVDLAKYANRKLPMDWDDPSSWAGLESGRRTIYGVPFELLDKFSNDGKICARDIDIPIDTPNNGKRLFALIGELEDDSELTLSLADGKTKMVDLKKAIPVLKGWPPCFDWHVDLVSILIKGIKSIHARNLDLFAATVFSGKRDELAETLKVVADAREKFIAKRKALRGLREFAPLFEKFSGHIAILPSPGNTNPRSSPIMKLFHKAGLSKHFAILTPRQFVDPNYFNSERFWITLYLGGESYYQSVGGEGSGDKALGRYLSTGGTLLVLPSGPYPFYYNEAKENVVNAGKFGLPVCGSGAKRDVKQAAGLFSPWEKPPEEHKFTFYLNSDQNVITSLPKEFPFPESVDPRWRPIANVLSPQDRYVPILTLQDETGQSYGDGAAWIEHRTGKLKGARLAYVWTSLLDHSEYRIPIITELFRYVLQNTPEPPFQSSCIYRKGEIKIDGELTESAWTQTIKLTDFSQLNESSGASCQLATIGRMLWDDKNLYIAFECEDEDIWAEWRNFDDPLWENEVVEVFIDPESDGMDYKEFEVNPANTVVDLNIHEVKEDGSIGDWRDNRKWNATGMETAVEVDGTIDNRNDKDKEWTVEMKIPFDNFQVEAPSIGDVWRVQLYRIDRPQSQDKPDMIFWSPTDTFHKPERFGYVQFVGNPYHDDFSNYPDESDGTPTWQILSGKWSVKDGVYIGTNSGTDGWIASGAKCGFDDWQDYTFSIRFKIVSRGSDWRDGPWFGFRHKDARNSYSLNFSDRDVQLHKVSRGVSTSESDPMASASWQPDQASCLTASCEAERLWHRLKISVLGAKIKVWLNGKSIIEVVDDEEPVNNGGIVLSARKWTQSRGDTIVKFDEFEVQKRAFR